MVLLVRSRFWLRGLRTSWARLGAVAALLAIGLLPALPLAHEVLSHGGAEDASAEHLCAEHATDPGATSRDGADHREHRGVPPSAPRKCPTCSDLILAKFTPPLLGVPAWFADQAEERASVVECEIPVRGEAWKSAQPRGPPRTI